METLKTVYDSGNPYGGHFSRLLGAGMVDVEEEVNIVKCPFLKYQTTQHGDEFKNCYEAECAAYDNAIGCKMFHGNPIRLLEKMMHCQQVQSLEGGGQRR